ncbi:uncharacterized protein LOC124336317 isoform X2 [Daphnia pulicaria]|uniref:uncharacterized protein LOC124336317 isoform X2 n=1 Tax=Daphnia pulicaria TaxID=35523 RepID=UPI001EEB566B|nr:uncharacterized protein LOC124336317 isoform X2 [Daphnia pulicaria]
MKSIFELIIAVLGAETARQLNAARIAADTSFALDSAGRSFIDKIAKLNLKGQLKGIRRALEQLAAQRKMDLNEIQIKLNEKATKFDLENLKTTVGEIDSNLMSLTQKFEKETAVIEIGHMPESCTDFKTIGYKMNGIFQIIGKKQIETVYCNFTSTNAEDLQKWIGYADIKSAPTYFYVQKNDHFGTTGIPIPFENEIINTEKAMDLTVGKFTAPRPGIYFFSFTGLPDFTASTSVVYFEVSLYLNGERIASGRVEDSNTVLFQRSPLTVQSTLNLKKDDQVWMEINDMSTGIQLHDAGGHYTHFTGFLLEEEIVASL